MVLIPGEYKLDQSFVDDVSWRQAMKELWALRLKWATNSARRAV